MFDNTSKHLSRAASAKFLANFIAVAVIIAGFIGGVARAQLAGTGAIAGTVQDPTGAVVAKATVTATNTDTNVATARTTTGAGDFNIALAPGPYTVTVTAQGFQGYKQENVTVDALATVTLNLKLTLGQASETVTITSAPPMLETSDASLGAVMDNQMYSNLPLMMGQGGNADQRRATDFEYLMPGVQGNFTSNNSTSNSGIVNGSGPAGGVSEIYIDGVNLPEADQVGDPRFTWTAIGVDAIDQFQVQTAGYSAQYSGQGVQNYSIKSGGNAYHGSLYEYNRNTIFDAWNFTNKVPTVNSQGVTEPGGIKAREIMNEFGIVINGPIIKNKLFLFGNYGQYRNQNGAKYTALTIPTAAMIGFTPAGQPLGYADFSGYAAANASGGAHIYDPATQSPLAAGAGCLGTVASPCSRTQFMGVKNGVPTADVIPGSRISTAANYYDKYMLQYEPLANQSLYTGNLNYGTPTGLANWYSTGRIDYTASPRNQIGVIVAFGRQASTGPNNLSGLGPPFNVSQSFHPVTTVDIVKDTWTINAHLVNQFAAGYGRYVSVSVTPDDAPQYSALTAGLTGNPVGQAQSGFPGITFSGGFDNPGAAQGGTVFGGYAWNSKVNNTYTVMDNVQWVFGKHNFTFGAQVVDAQFNYYKVLGPSGPMAYTFTAGQTGQFATPTTSTALNANTGSSVASYLLGGASAGTTTANSPGLGTRWLDPSFWGQDDFKVNEKLTFNLGLRWDIFPSIQEAHNIFSFINPSGVNSVTGNLGTLEFAGNGDPALYCNCKSPSPVSMKNIAPRIGMAYSITPKTVLRASYDVAFARGDWTSGSQSGSPSTLGFTPAASAPGGISSAPAFYWDNSACAAGLSDGVACGWTGSIVNPAPPAGGTSLAEYATTETVALGNSGSATQTYFDPYRGSRTPEFINWTFGLQRQITRDMSLSVTYVGSEGHHISSSKAIGSRNNELPESMAALAGYNVVSGALVPCTGAACTAPLLSQKATAANLALAATILTVPNPYVASKASYYASNSVYQYYLPFPQFSGVTDTTSFVGNTNFEALEISVRQRAAHNVDFMFNYTYSKAIDDIGTFRVGDNARLDRSLSTTDLPQNLTSSVVYSSPYGHGKLQAGNFLVRSLVSDWNLSGIFSYHSGPAILFTGSTGCGGSGILNQCMPFIVPGQASRINGSYGHAAGFTTATTYSQEQYFNPAAFVVHTNATTSSGQVVGVGQGSALYVPGNATRVAALNTWGPGYYDLDLGLKRLFPIYEKVTIQFEADLINATNHIVFAAPSGAVNGSGYGLITNINSFNNPRDAQFSVRLAF